MAICPFMAHCPLYGPLSSLRPSVSSTVICSPLKPYVPFLAFSFLSQYFVPSMALCPLYGPLPLYSQLSPLWPLLLYRPLLLYNPLLPLWPLFSLWPSVSPTALCPLYWPQNPLKHLSPLWFSKGPINWKIPPPREREISADVIWGKKYEKVKRKRGKCKKRKEERKREKGKENYKRGSKKIK
jgi:hypothetical protein